jgi:hypothetical protein
MRIASAVSKDIDIYPAKGPELALWSVQQYIPTLADVKGKSIAVDAPNSGLVRDGILEAALMSCRARQRHQACLDCLLYLHSWIYTNVVLSPFLRTLMAVLPIPTVDPARRCIRCASC